MKVILLAAGQSKRMNPVSDKNFLKFCGKELIRHQIERIASAGFKDFLIVANESNVEKIQHIASQIPHIKYDFAIQKNLEYGMADAILSCKDKIGDEEILIVSSNDVVSKSAYQLIYDASSNKNYDIFILGKKVRDYFPGGYLDVDQNMNIKSIIEKPGKGNEPSDLVNLVVHFYRNPIKLFQYLENVKSEKDDIYETALNKIIKSGEAVKALMYDDIWHPIKYPWHIFDVAYYIFQESNKFISKNAQISPNAYIKGDVIIEDGVRIFEGAIINGPCYLGKNTIVANNALVRNSFLGDSCTIGFGSEIARSYIGNHCWFHTNYIGDSIIGDNCSFGSGAVTANLRLDEEEIFVNIRDEKINTGVNKFGALFGNNIRIGVNSSIMPGVKIGSDTFIASGIIISSDVEEKKYVRGKWLLKIDENKSRLNPERRRQMKNDLI